MDDLISVNWTNFFEICKKIYPSSLPLSDTSKTAMESDYLDLNIKIENNGPIFAVYSKTNDFNFKVDSNVSRCW